MAQQKSLVGNFWSPFNFYGHRKLFVLTFQAPALYLKDLTETKRKTKSDGSRVLIGQEYADFLNVFEKCTFSLNISLAVVKTTRIALFLS